MNKLRWTLLVLLVVPIAASAQGPGVFALRTMLQDKNPEIRMKAAEALGRVGAVRASSFCARGCRIKALLCGSPWWRHWALSAVGSP